MAQIANHSVSVQSYARRLSVRLWTLHVLAALPLSAACAGAVLFAAFLVCDPVLTSRTALAVWLTAGAAFTASLALTLRALRRYRGGRIASLFESRDQTMASRVRSALELSQSEPTAHSSELAQAHVRAVEESLGALPPEQVLPWSRALRPSSMLALVLLSLCASWVATDPRLAAFANALWSPAPVRADGTRIARVVTRLQARLTYPSYLGREPTTLTDPTTIHAPRGTNVELQVTAALPSDSGRLRLGAKAAQDIALVPAADGSLVARFTAKQDADLRVQIDSAGVRYEDPTPRALRVVADRVPVVTIESPANATLVEPSDVITLRFVASDDAGIASVDLHVRLPSGEEKQQRLWSSLDDGGPRAELRASSAFAVSDFDAREGEQLVLWLAAHDGDLVSGPNTGKSAEVTLEIATPGKRLAAFIPSLQAATDAAVRLLGNRLERPVPDEANPAKTRFAELERETRDLLIQLDEVVRLAEQAEGETSLDTDQLRGVRRRTTRLLDAEAQLHAEPVRALAPRSAADARAVDELERDVILLADLLAKAHVDEAGAIADELRDLKTRIKDLLSELGKTQSPEAERKLLAEIAQAERRLAELSQSLSRMATRVPNEFVNREALEAPETDSTLQDLADAVRGKDLKSAAEHLEKLAQQIDELAKQIGEGGVRLRESRFGPRDRALAGARQKLDMLSEEQARLAGRSEDVMQDALSRAQGAEGAQQSAQQMAPQAQAIRDHLGGMQLGQRQDWQTQALERAKERLGDARDALASGDLAAANGMAQGARQDLEQAAAELENEARMFPGHQGETSRNAEIARNAADAASRLSEQIQRSAQRHGGQLTPGDRERLQGDVDPQRKTREAAADLQREMEKGPDGMPLSPDGAESLEAAREAMQRAEQALQRGDARDAAEQQADASQRLQKLSEKLAEQQRQKSGGSSGGDEHAGSQGSTDDGPVKIPGAEEFKGPKAMRRKLLDAMREASPKGFEAAIQRYYQELLR